MTTAPDKWGLVRAFLAGVIGEDPSREGLHETPERVVKAWAFEWGWGYTQDPARVLKTFEDGAAKYDEMIVVSGLPVYSHCEHHIAPFWGEAHIGYIPDGRIVGLSKLGHLVNIYARRLQVQERLTTQIVDALEEHLRPRGCGVILRCRHLCMESRGLRAPGAITITSALRGVMLSNESARAEFLSLKSRASGPL